MPTPPPAPTAYDSTVVVDSAPLEHWRAEVEADPEPALLSRLLQKLGCQRALMVALAYHHSPGSGVANVTVDFIADSPRASLLARQWRTLVPVKAVQLERAPPAVASNDAAALKPARRQ